MADKNVNSFSPTIIMVYETFFVFPLYLFTSIFARTYLTHARTRTSARTHVRINTKRIPEDVLQPSRKPQQKRIMGQRNDLDPFSAQFKKELLKEERNIREMRLLI